VLCGFVTEESRSVIVGFGLPVKATIARSFDDLGDSVDQLSPDGLRGSDLADSDPTDSTHQLDASYYGDAGVARD
jgi:hypothetical protein